MAYTALELINQSWQLAGIVGPQLQTMDGFQTTQGLTLLNNLLDFMQVQTEYLPYFTYETTVDCVAQQEQYFIENAAVIETVTFTFSDVRYSMQSQSPKLYFGSNRVNTIFTLPFTYTYLRRLGGSELYLYPIPDQAYQLQILGKFFLADVSLETDLSLTVDTSYIEFLRWNLADYMATQYGVGLTADKKRILDSYKRKLMYMSPPDLMVGKKSVLGNGGAPFDLQSTGIYAGFTPS